MEGGGEEARTSGQAEVCEGAEGPAEAMEGRQGRLNHRKIPTGRGGDGRRQHFWTRPQVVVDCVEVLEVV